MVASEQTMQKSLEILQSLQDCDRFEQDPRNRGRIRLLYDMGENHRPRRKFFEVEDFFKAVDYYYENRESEVEVNLAMTERDGFVRVYAPFIEGSERHVVLRIRNYFVPQILEFGYLLLRQEQKSNRRSNAQI